MAYVQLTTSGLTYNQSNWNDIGGGSRPFSGCFDGDDTTTYWRLLNVTTSDWGTIQFASGRRVAKYSFIYRAGYYFNSWKLYGSNNGTDWTEIDSRTGQDGIQNVYKEFVTTTPGYYTYYKFGTLVASSTAHAFWYEIKMYYDDAYPLDPSTAYTKSLTEALTWTPLATVKQTAKKLTEASSLTAVLYKTISTKKTESRTWTDVITKVNVINKILTELFTSTDVQAIKRTGKGILEAVTWTSSVNILKTIGKLFTETATYTIVFTKLKVIHKNITETVTHSEVFTKVYHMGRIFIESRIWTDRLYGKKNGVNMKYLKKYAEKVGSYVKKYFDI